ncbi:chromate reductase [Colwellia chukchiensis]|uniref:Chromate reductase n=1 Tax=Colwellia chukchiensis TaxID=641665 RepID=A0A1H7NYI7_9GAMM|nr:NAD(P)H-dependent oxidoreductase [Colwellia chukchiensis]SEL28612.1 chromate reductase [Colwellia chukchiensis]
MTSKTHIVAISGSLRKSSYNTAAINAAAQLLPENCSLELLDIAKLPLYNQELDGELTPEAVLTLTQKVANADAILFSTPEYNYSVPGVLKNAIDWLSRQQPQPFSGKPAAIMSASMSVLGGARAQYHLRQIMIYLDVHFINKPEVMIASAHNKFNQQGELDDQLSRDFIQQLMAALVTWHNQLNK